ncbi:hypothetical protein Hanom_Chr07g00610211 [Helianthus anomalus]
MADSLEAACNDPLPAYADLTKHVAEDGVDALRLTLEPSIIYEEPSPAEASVAASSTDTLMKVIPSDHIQRCGLVYERRRGGHSGKNPVEDQEVMDALVDEGNIDKLIIDPHLLECYGEVLHTPAEVMATLSKK